MPKATKEASQKSNKDLVSKETSKIQKKSNTKPVAKKGTTTKTVAKKATRSTNATVSKTSKKAPSKTASTKAKSTKATSKKNTAKKSTKIQPLLKLIYWNTMTCLTDTIKQLSRY